MTEAQWLRVFPMLFPIVFAALWLAVTTLLGALSGWFRLQRHYPRGDEPALATLRMRSGRMGGGVHMNGCLTLSACPSGLRIGIWRIFGPFQRPLFIAWSEIGATRRTFLFMPMMRLGFGSPELGQLTVEARTWERLVLEAGTGAAHLRATAAVADGEIHRAYLWQWAIVTAVAGCFFYAVSRATGDGTGLPLAVCVLFPAIGFGSDILVRWLVEG